MKAANKTYAIAFYILFFSASLFSQVSGDYRSNGYGKWNAPATWQTFNGTSWVPAAVAPSGSENITIQASDSVDVNIPVTITGKIIGFGGALGNSINNLTFGNNGTYEHAVNSRSIPSAIWGIGSTCLITGVVDTMPSNTRQNYYNFSWNCPNYGFLQLNLGWGGNTINGDLNIKGSLLKTYLRLTSASIGNQAPGANVITINGDVNISDTNSALTATGSSAQDTVAIYVKGNIISNGNFNLANGSGAQCNWYLSGDLKLQDGMMITQQNAGALADSFFFVGKTKQTFYKADSLGSNSYIKFVMSPGSIVDLTTTSITGGSETTFAQASGSTLMTSHAKGLSGNFSMTWWPFAVRLPFDGNYQYNGAVPQIDTLLPAVVNNLTINNPTTVSFTKATTVNGILTLKQGILDNSVFPIIIGSGGSVVYAGGHLAVPFNPPIQSLTEINEIGKFESPLPAYWTKALEPDGSVLSWGIDQFRSMGHSLKISKAVTSDSAMWQSENMCDMWCPQHLSNVDILLGAWVKTQGVNTNPVTDDSKWYIQFTFYDIAGTLIKKTKLPVDQSSPSTIGWIADTNAVGQTVLPRNSWKTIIQFVGGKNATGTVWADDFIILGRGYTWAGQDWNTSVGLPAGWNYWLPPNGGYDGLLNFGFENTLLTNETSHSGQFSLKFDLPLNRKPHDGWVGTKRFAIDSTIHAGDILTIGVWIKASGLFPDSAVKYPYLWSVGLSPMFHSGGGNNDPYDQIQANDYSFVLPDSAEFDWKYFELPVTVPSDPNAKYFSVRIHPYALFSGTVYFDDLTVTSPNMLPVELSSFICNTYGKNVLLTWTTASEKNNMGFDIERQIENSVWEKISFIKGNGTTTAKSSYRFTENLQDIHSTGKLKYRLKQIDFNGTFKYSDVKEINNILIPESYSLSQNYPNPFNPDTKIKYTLPVASNIKIVLYNAIGQLVKEACNTIQDAGSYEFVIEASSLSSGIYYYKLNAVSTDGRQSFTKVKKMTLLK